VKASDIFFSLIVGFDIGIGGRRGHRVGCWMAMELPEVSWQEMVLTGNDLHRTGQSLNAVAMKCLL
jgi:hypothetical protein